MRLKPSQRLALPDVASGLVHPLNTMASPNPLAKHTFLRRIPLLQSILRGKGKASSDSPLLEELPEAVKPPLSVGMSYASGLAACAFEFGLSIDPRTPGVTGH